MNSKKIIISALLLIFIIQSCTDIDDTLYIPVSPVVIDLTQVPLDKLSDYHFFDGDLKNQNPTLNVLPFKPTSEAFHDYAKAKRFVWMPLNTVATYVSDDTTLNFPEGSALIKTLYYNNVEPSNSTKILETQLLIKKDNGWNTFVYIWNDDQTEAFLDTTNNGAIVPVTWLESGNSKSVDYKIQSQSECISCHKLNNTTTPIGVKPQNLNSFYTFSTGIQNQLSKWKLQGYVGNDIPSSIYSAVDWRDVNQTLEKRSKSYIDINCAHCHSEGGDCDTTPQRFNYSNVDLQLFGVCLTPNIPITNNPYIISSHDANHSIVTYRMNTINTAEMMPPIGRTIIHQEGYQLIRNWINSMPTNCN